MANVAMVIPYRKTPNRDEGVLKLCVQAWQALKPAEIIVVDGSPEPNKIEGVTYLYRPYEGMFNLSFMRNVGARYAVDKGYPYVQIMDNDIFPQNTNYFQKCLQLIESCDMIYPYVANSPQTVPASVGLEEQAYKDFLNVDLNKIERKRFSYSTIFQKAEVLQTVHGYDEAFQLWGAEDDDYSLRARRSGFIPKTLPKPILVHSWHRGDTSKEARKSNQYARNVQRFKLTVKSLLPDIRMPDDWGLQDTPRTDLVLK